MLFELVIGHQFVSVLLPGEFKNMNCFIVKYFDRHLMFEIIIALPKYILESRLE